MKLLQLKDDSTVLYDPYDADDMLVEIKDLLVLKYGYDVEELVDDFWECIKEFIGNE